MNNFRPPKSYPHSDLALRLHPWSRTARLRSCLTLLVALTLLVSVLGCTNRYLIKLTNGTVVTSKGKPKLNEERGIYEYKNAEGKQTYVPTLRVMEIEPVPWPPPKNAESELLKMNEYDG